MRHPRFSTLHAVLFGVALLGSPITHADPAADYRQGVDAYYRGDLPLAMRLLRSASESGDGKASAFLGGVLDIAEEDQEAVLMYRRAVDLGAIEGAYGLGTMYAKGEGVEQDPGKAVEWLTQAAEAGHGEAAMVLGEAYLAGDLGLVADREQALAWLQRGSDAGYKPAGERLLQVRKQ